ncbi:MAG: VTT domain-containing protein [Pseudomonadota bacterium]
MRQLPAFLRRLDATRGRAVLVSLLLFGLVLSLFVIGRTGTLYDPEAVQRAMAEVAGSWWGLPTLITLFIILAYVGFPQAGLIGVSVFAFGPMLGALYAWIATLCSGAVTFYTGRLVGEATLRKHGGNLANRLSVFIGRNAFMASAIVRNVPTGPFLLVNMIFGATRAKFLPYLAGLAVGASAKILLITFFGASVLQALQGNPVFAALAALAAVATWVAIALYARGQLRSIEQEMSAPGPPGVDSSKQPAE